jgi:multidrug efflux pump subunit AcrB
MSIYAGFTGAPVSTLYRATRRDTAAPGDRSPGLASPTRNMYLPLVTGAACRLRHIATWSPVAPRPDRHLNGLRTLTVSAMRAARASWPRRFQKVHGKDIRIALPADPESNMAGIRKPEGETFSERVSWPASLVLIFSFSCSSSAT